MRVTVHIPSMLRASAEGASRLSISAPTVGGVLDELRVDYEALYLSVCDETGAVRRHVNLFVNDTNIRDLDALETRLSTGDIIFIMPAVSGG